MSFNRFHFDEALNNELNGFLKDITIKNELVLDFLKRYLVSTNNQVQSPHCDVFVNLLIKIRINLEAGLKLLPLLEEDARFKTSINVILRAIVDDTINFYYLLGFVLPQEENKSTLNNELNVLHKEFLKSIEEVIKIETKKESDYNLVFGGNNIESQDFKSEIIRDNPELFSMGEYKKNNELRQSSNKSIKDLVKGYNGHFVSENNKLEFIGKKVSTQIDELKVSFKYLSQFHHFSPKMHEFLLSDFGLDLVYFDKVLLTLIHLLDKVQGFIKVDNEDFQRQQFQVLMKKFLNGEKEQTEIK